MERIGITSTIPVEVVFAGGHVPVDLNNIFITSHNPGLMVKRAEEDGLPRNLCSWVKGIYSALLDNPDIKTVLAVTEGDCANTLSMLDLLKNRGIEIISFAYPFNREYEMMDRAISRLESIFGVTRKMTGEKKEYLDSIREKALRIDEMTWRDGVFSGFENHLYLISCSDFDGNPEEYGKKLDGLIRERMKVIPDEFAVRLGYCGVPTIFSNFYDYLETKGVRVVYNEMQRQFAMPRGGCNIVEQYLNYTYPYSFEGRISDIREQIEKRRLDGMIHYVQSFCHHQINDVGLKSRIPTPLLTLEGDRPETLNERAIIRIDSSIEMLSLGWREKS